MPETTGLTGRIDRITLDRMEREATPTLLTKLSIQLHLAGLSLSNTVSFLEIFGAERARSTVHNWVHEADLQPGSDRSPDQVAVDETVIQIENAQYWLSAAVDPDLNESLHTKLETTRTNDLAAIFVGELCEKRDVDDAVFLVDRAKPLENACTRHGLNFKYERHGNRNSVERIFREVKRRIPSFPNCFSRTDPETADEWLRSFAFAWNQLL